MAINAQELQGQWNQLKGKVKEKWGQLSDDDLNIGGGNFDQIIGKIQQKTGEGREAIEKFFGSLTQGGGSAISGAAEKVRDLASGAPEVKKREEAKKRKGKRNKNKKKKKSKKKKALRKTKTN